MSEATPKQTPPRPIRVVLVEDHEMVAEAISMAIGEVAGIELVARSGSIAAAINDTRRYLPDIVVLDRRLPDGDGIEAIGRLEEAAPGVRVLVLTGDATALVAARVAEAGGVGLVLKSSPLQDLEVAVRQAATGQMVFGPGLLAGVIARLSGKATSTGASLTARERETLSLLAEGTSTEEISERLGVARNTARNHVQRVLEKLGARSKLEAVAIARREDLLD